MSRSPSTSRFWTCLIASVCALGLLNSVVSTQSLHFYGDDPIVREPESQDASKAQPYDIKSLYEMTYNLFVTAATSHRALRAKNINTIDEVPDSSWFTNRIGATQVTRGRHRSRPQRGAPPDPSTLGADSERRPPAPIRASRRRTRRARPSSSSSIPPISRRARPERWPSPPRSSGRSATTRSSRS